MVSVASTDPPAPAGNGCSGGAACEKQPGAPLHASSASSSVATAATSSSSPSFVTRVAALPVVAEACSAANGAVASLAERNRHVRRAVETASGAVSAAVSAASKYAEPYQQRLAPHLTRADDAANKVLDLVEEKFPIITQPSSKVISSAKGAVIQVKCTVASSKAVSSAANAVKNLEAALAAVLKNLECIVDKYLPEDGEEEVKINGGAANGNHHDVAEKLQVRRAVHLGADVHRRVVRRLVARVKQLQASVPMAAQELMKLKEAYHIVNATAESLRSLNERASPLVASLRENAAHLKESGLERAKAIDAQFEISGRVEPVVRTYLAEVSAITKYIESLFPSFERDADSEQQQHHAVGENMVRVAAEA